jgi:cation transport regulator
MGEHMPYKSNSELPETVKNSLPDHGQDIYRKAFNNGWEEYKKHSERRGDEAKKEDAHKVAWSAVKKIYEKDSKGNWVEKD